MKISGRKGRYGIDAPYVPGGMMVGVIASIMLAVFAHPRAGWVAWAVILLITATLYLHTTLRGKFRVWRDQLDGMRLRGDERLLDLGCGRGAVLLMAAQHLPKGRAVGVDIWSRKDQCGNAIEITRANAMAEGVADRVELHTADMRKLPFDDASFDAIVSNVAIHNIPTRSGRDQAIDEAWRVLRHGGRLFIADISKSSQYRRRLAALGATAIRHNLGWRMWWGGPWMPTMLIEARKPDG